MITMEIIESYKLKNGNTLQIIPDDCCDNNPRDNDNLGIMACHHRRYILGDKTGIDYNRFTSWTGVRTHIQKHLNASVIIPVYMLDHSGLRVRCRDFSDCDPGQWDSGQIGFIFTTAEKIRENFQTKRATKKLREKAREILLSEIEEYDSYLSGDCYGYNVVGPAGEIIDSCYGYLGDYRKTILTDFKDQITG